jgi:hypothetical protein
LLHVSLTPLPLFFAFDARRLSRWYDETAWGPGDQCAHCGGYAEAGSYCATSKDKCETHCGKKWCTDEAPTPPTPTPEDGYCCLHATQRPSAMPRSTLEKPRRRRGSVMSVCPSMKYFDVWR